MVSSSHDPQSESTQSENTRSDSAQPLSARSDGAQPNSTRFDSTPSDSTRAGKSGAESVQSESVQSESVQSESHQPESGVRLYVDQPLAEAQAIALSLEQANYLFAVMRLPVGALISLFNGRDGIWRARVAEANKRRGILICEAQTKALQPPPDLWLLFTPVKKERTNFIVEKAVELGVARLQPVSTRYMNAERWKPEKQQAHAIEAAEQCGASYVPSLGDLTPLDRILSDWPKERLLFWADEALAGQTATRLSDIARGTASAILIGPEGGFAEVEKAKLRELAFVRPISLGPRILRAETAALAAITLWQSSCGDWS